MSTIEEAREQARETLADYHRVNAGGYGAGHHASLARALRTLLDATEPPEAQEAAEPMRDADGDMISSGEHRKISMSGDSFFVCDTCTNVLGLNVRWDHASKREDHQAAVESLPDEPTEDEREALVKVIRLFFQNWRAIGKVPAALEVSIDSLEGAVDDLIDLDAPKDGDYHEGFEEGVKVGRAGSGSRPITDEMVEAAARALRDDKANRTDVYAVPTWEDTRYGDKLVFRGQARAALEAAEGARR